MAPRSCGQAEGAPWGRAGCWKCCQCCQGRLCPTSLTSSHSLRHCSLCLLPKNPTSTQPPPRHRQTLLHFGVNVHIWSRKALQLRHAAMPSPLLSCPTIPPLLTELPRMSQESKNSHCSHRMSIALQQTSHLRALAALRGPGKRAEKLPHEPPCPKAVHAHPSLPGDIQHSLKNTEEGKTQLSALLPHTLIYVQAVP